MHRDGCAAIPKGDDAIRRGDVRSGDGWALRQDPEKPRTDPPEYRQGHSAPCGPHGRSTEALVPIPIAAAQVLAQRVLRWALEETR